MKITFTETVQLITKSGETYTGGRYDPGTETTSPEYKASVQPCHPREIERLPQGFRASEVLCVYIKTDVNVELLQNDVTPIEDSALVLYNSKRYVILNSEYWPPTMRQSHWKLMVVRETVGAT